MEVTKKNGFNRVFLEKEIQMKAVINLTYPGYYFVGNSEEKIYIGHKNAPAHLIISNINGDTLKNNMNIQLRTGVDYDWRAIEVSVADQMIYLADGRKGFIITSDLQNRHEKTIDLSNWLFDKYLPISGKSIILRNYDFELKQNILTKVNWQSGKLNEYILKKQIDGIFCTDGLLLHSDGKIIYLFYYRNQFDVLDQNLNLLYTGTTMDTISRAKIKLTDQGAGKIGLAEPALRVNRSAFTNQQYLFVNSVLKADNESLKSFKNNSTIDIYNLTEGGYAGSFYVPFFKNQRADDIVIVENVIFAIYQENLVIFTPLNIDFSP